MNFQEQLKQGIPVDMNIDLPDRSLILLGVAMFVAILLAMIIAGVVTTVIAKRIS